MKLMNDISMNFLVVNDINIEIYDNHVTTPRAVPNRPKAWTRVRRGKSRR